MRGELKASRKLEILQIFIRRYKLQKMLCDPMLSTIISSQIELLKATPRYGPTYLVFVASRIRGSMDLGMMLDMLKSMSLKRSGDVNSLSGGKSV